MNHIIRDDIHREWVLIQGLSIGGVCNGRVPAVLDKKEIFLCCSLVAARPLPSIVYALSQYALTHKSL
jgi:esterase/lipase